MRPTGLPVSEHPRRSRRIPLFLFVVAVILLDWGVGQFAEVWARYSPDEYAERVTTCAKQPRDYVIVGGSPVAEGIDPAQLQGMHWQGRALHDGYAVGLSGGTTSEVYHAMQRACPTGPDLLIYGITATDLNDSRHEPHGPYSLMTTSDWFDWVRSRPKTAEWVTRHYWSGRAARVSSIWHGKYGIRMWAAEQIDQNCPGSCPDSAREAIANRELTDRLRNGNGYAPAAGFVHQRYDHAKAVKQQLAPFAYLDKYRIGAHLTYLDRLIDWAHQRGTDLVLVDMPVTADLEAKYPQEVALYRSTLREFVSARGLVLIEASREAVKLDDSDFADLIHLNGGGARKLSVWLRAALERRANDPGRSQP